MSVTLDKKLDLLIFAGVGNAVHIHVYTCSRDGKCHIYSYI